MNFNIFGYTMQIRKDAAIATIIVLIIIAGLVGYKINKASMPVVIDKTGREASTEGKPSGNTNVEATTNIDNIIDVAIEQAEIKVYIIGCVNNPGVVTLIKGQLIIDAINAAGGATENADLNSVNLVYKLKDNVMLRIKSVEEASTAISEAGTGIEIIGDSGGSVMYTPEQGESGGGLININEATDKELDTLPGIGLSTAKDIINFREKNGPFKALKDIMKVPGIKESRFEKIKDYIAIE